MDVPSDWGLSQKVIGAAIDVHNELGPGLTERVYEECFCWQLGQKGLRYKRQFPVAIRFQTLRFEGSLRLDVVVEERLAIEIKSVEQLLRLHTSQLLTYLKMSGLKTGLLINFNSSPLKDGIRRFVVP